MSPFHPELRAGARWLGLFPLHVRAMRLLDRGFGAARGTPMPPQLPDVSVRDCEIAAHDGERLRVRLYQPVQRTAALPALLWMHGGGLVIGSPEQDEASNLQLVRQLGICVAAVRYRRAPEHPFPVPLEDCYSALAWLQRSAGELGVDVDRLAVGGMSAGAGLAAALAQLALDRGQVSLRFQLLIYPMLDDRSAVRAGVEHRKLRIWSQRSNEYGWRAYLGHAPGRPDPRPYAVPARRQELQGLPPAWIGVGSCDLFHEECVEYAARLHAAGVPCELQLVPGAYHGFDAVSARAPVVKRFRASYVDALRRGLMTKRS
jgi:acetyl esterase/lipase